MHTLNLFFQAKSIAVIGASNNPLKVGNQIFRNLIQNNADKPFAKKIIPVNPHMTSLMGQKAFASIVDIPDPVEVVIIVTPAVTVNEIIDQIISRNQKLKNAEQVKAVLIISAGFAETSKEGKALQEEVTQKLKQANIRMVGPNSLGLISSVNHLNASFAQKMIPSGNIALISQSGAMLTALFDVISSSQLGISFSVSLGNKADINENECLEYAANDPQTRVIALYLESFTDLPSFFELVSSISKKKPVIVLKGGTSQRGQAASASHTAALATNQVLLSAAAKQMGFVLVNTIEELINCVFFLSAHQYLIQNALIITNAGGPAVNTIDRLAEEHVELAQWSTFSKGELERLVPNIPAHNPLDLLGDASSERYKFAIQIAQRDPNIDSILVIVTPQAVTDIPAIVDQLIQLKGKKPILVSLMGGDHLEKYRQKLRLAGFTCADFPNDLVNILQYTRKVTDFHFVKRRFIPSTIHREQLANKPSLTTLKSVFSLLKENGLKVPGYKIVNKESFTDLRKFTYPFFAKTANLDIQHKKEVGALIGKVDSFSQAAKAYHALLKFGPDVLFQEMVDINTEILLGIENDPQFGLYLSIGLGGSHSNILADRSYVFLPATKEELRSAWQQTKAHEILKKTETSDQVIDVMVNLQKVVMKNSWIKSIEINPLAINDQGAWVVDIKVTSFTTVPSGDQR